MKGWAENSLPTFSKHGGWLRRSVHQCVLVVLCTFSICALTLNVALWAKAMMDSPPGSFPCFKGALGMRRVVVVGMCLGTEAPCQMRSCQMDRLQLFIRPGGPGAVAAPGEWLKKTKKKNQTTHLCSWGPTMASGTQTLQQVGAHESGKSFFFQKENRNWKQEAWDSTLKQRPSAPSIIWS